MKAAVSVIRYGTLEICLKRRGGPFWFKIILNEIIVSFF